MARHNKNVLQALSLLLTPATKTKTTYEIMIHDADELLY